MGAELVKVDQSYAQQVSEITRAMSTYRDDLMTCSEKLGGVLETHLWQGNTFENFRDAELYLNQYMANVDQCRADVITAINDLILNTDTFFQDSKAMTYLCEG